MRDTRETGDWTTRAEPELMTVEDVARRLNASDSFIYELIAEGRLKHYRLGKGQGGIRVSEDQLREFLRQSERGGNRTAKEEAPKRSASRSSFSFLPPPS